MGACGFGNYRPTRTFAPNTAFYNGSATCGACFEVTGPLGTQVWMAADECPKDGNELWCSGDVPHFDLNQAAFSDVAQLSWGVTNLAFRPIVCPTTEFISLISGWGTGSINDGYLQVHFFNHKVPIDRVRVKDSSVSTWTSLTRTTYNAWEWSSGHLIVYPVSYELTSIYGETVTFTLNSKPSSSGQRIIGTVQFSTWPTDVASNTCPTVYEYDIYWNGLNDANPDHGTAQHWNTDAGANLAYTAQLPDNATRAAQKSMSGYSEWGFQTRGCPIPEATIEAVELQIYSTATTSALQLIWNSYSDGNIVDIPLATNTYTYYRFEKADFGSSLPALSKLALKNSQSGALASIAVTNFRIIPSDDIIVGAFPLSRHVEQPLLCNEHILIAYRPAISNLLSLT